MEEQRGKLFPDWLLHYAHRVGRKDPKFTEALRSGASLIAGRRDVNKRNHRSQSQQRRDRPTTDSLAHCFARPQ